LIGLKLSRNSLKIGWASYFKQPGGAGACQDFGKSKIRNRKSIFY